MMCWLSLNRPCIRRGVYILTAPKKGRGLASLPLATRCSESGDRDNLNHTQEMAWADSTASALFDCNSKCFCKTELVNESLFRVCSKWNTGEQMNAKSRDPQNALRFVSCERFVGQLKFTPCIIDHLISDPITEYEWRRRGTHACLRCSVPQFCNHERKEPLWTSNRIASCQISQWQLRIGSLVTRQWY